MKASLGYVQQCQVMHEQTKTKKSKLKMSKQDVKKTAQLEVQLQLEL